MLIGVVQVTDYLTSKEQLNIALQYADGIEFRLDYLSPFNIEVVSQLRTTCKLPIIFTLRKQSQGGHYPLSESERLKDILTVCQLQPDYLDLEYDIDIIFIKQIKQQFPNIKLISSYHNFIETPADLTKILNSMINSYFYSYKIATYAKSTLDSLRMLSFIRSMKDKLNLSGICMGEAGTSTRILSPIIGNNFTYANITEKSTTAPGQISLETLVEIYHFKKLNRETEIYALIGNPIDKSVGHILHNKAIEILDKNAVYIKLHIEPEILTEAINFCRQLGFQGLSVTMPLKEVIITELDEIEKDSLLIKAINTVTARNKKWLGSNTDGKGAILALKKISTLNNKEIIILGAGGSAKAIAYEALKNGANVTLINRTHERATILAKELGCQFININQLKDHYYDIIINTVPINLIKSDDLKYNTIAMDIVYQPIETDFLKQAKKAKCKTIPGYEMYVNQALLQIQSWFEPNNIKIEEIKIMMINYFLQ